MYQLIQEQDGLKLINTEDAKEKPVWVDFQDASLNQRRARLSKEDGLIKACWVGKDQRRLLDCTAGLGQDAFLLAAYGFEVTMLERNPVILSLLKDGFERARNDEQLKPILERMTLIEADAISFLDDNKDTFHVVYADPMFPTRKKKALVKKEMRALHHIVGIDQDVDQLIALGLDHGAQKVVVKRPRLSTWIYQEPCYTYHFQSTRFDVYRPSPKP